jgi:hypothetical protein
LKGKSILTIFAIATLLLSISENYSSFASADDSVDDAQIDERDKTDKEKIKEKVEDEKQKLKEFREDYKTKLEEKKNQFADYKKELREKYKALKDEYKEKYKQLRISTGSSSDATIAAESSTDDVDHNYQLEIKLEELKLLKQEFREEIKSLKLEAREHFDAIKSEMKNTIADRKNKMKDRIHALKEQYKQEIIEHKSSDSTELDGYPEELSDKKISICHIPPGNSDNAKTLTISVNAVRTHLSHGDYLDECEDQHVEEVDEEEVEEEDTDEDETEDDSQEDGQDYEVELKENLGLEQNN